MENLGSIAILTGVGIFLSFLLLRIGINIYIDEKWMNEMSQEFMPSIKEEIKQENIANSLNVKE